MNGIRELLELGKPKLYVPENVKTLNLSKAKCVTYFIADKLRLINSLAHFLCYHDTICTI